MRAVEKIDLRLFYFMAINFGSFTIKEHEKNPNEPFSPIYLDLRSLPAGIYNLMAHLMRNIAKRERLIYDYVIGIPKAGEPIAEAFAKLVGKPLLRMEKIKTETGRKIGQKIFGSFIPGKSALLIDDVIDRSHTKEEACDNLGANGLITEAIIVHYDRERGGCERLRQEGKRVFAVRKVTEMLQFLVEQKKIIPERRDEIVTYIMATASE